MTHPWIAQAQGGIRFGLACGPWWEAHVLIEYVRAIEDFGVDSFWAIDHPILFGADCWSMLAALASTTQRIRLGSLVSCVYYRHPALLARMAADVDRLSHGRLVLGLGIGDSAVEFQRMGIPLLPVPQRQQGLEETIRIVNGLWGRQPFSFAGEQFTVSEASVAPGPVQQPYVPILIAGGGERVTLRQVAEHADASSFGEHATTGGVGTLDDVRRRFDALQRHCAAVGRPYESILRTHSTLLLLLAETETELQSKLKAIPPARLAMWRSSSLVGTPGEAVAYYRALIDAGMQYFIAFVYGNDIETPRLLMEQVAPQLRVG
jgi:alkanesulfonate monooxygenase SsuD/methylene tetrahydromethanopterin reductase-like flavin-dependent oxidoreductase (luciferase family)